MTGSLRRLVFSVVLSFLLAAAAGAQSPGRDSPALRGSIDDLQLQVAARAPAFGGLFVDEAKGTINVWSWNETALGATEAEAAVRAVFGDRLPAGRIRILPGTYGFQELKGWQARLTPLLALPGVVLTDVDDAKNRLTVGVESEQLIGRIRDHIAGIGVPLEAVDVVRTPPMRFATRLNTRHRPLVGSLQIAFSLGTCTEGFNAVRNGVAGFVTNSHCTRRQGGVEKTVFYQPAISTSNRVGVETVDPVYFTGGSCPGGRRCRFSDSAFIRRDSAVGGTLGRIARTSLNSINWNGTATFRIVQEVDPLAGQVVVKVGAVTGRTQGSVVRVCADENDSLSDVTLFCQYRANLKSAKGDSGSPVFRVRNSPLAGDVWLVGLMWGNDSAGTVIAFSPMVAGVQKATAPAELGPLTTCYNGSC